MTNEHSEKYEDIKAWYEAGVWKKKAVRNAVIQGWITEEEYEEITGKPYRE